MAADGAPVMVRDEAAAAGGQLRLVIPPGSPMRRVLALLGVDHLLPVYPGIAQACGQHGARQAPLSWPY